MKTLRLCAIFATIWVICMGRNPINFYDKCEKFEGLCDRLYFLASFFVSMTKDIEDIPLFCITTSLKASWSVACFLLL